jgi:hypothetical protein
MIYDAPAILILLQSDLYYRAVKSFEVVPECLRECKEV